MNKDYKNIEKTLLFQLKDTIIKGQTFHYFKKIFKPYLDKLNLDIDKKNLEIIYGTFFHFFWAKDRYKCMIKNIEDRPYWQYDVHFNNETRDIDKEFNEKVFLYNDPFWENNFPPNSWNCKCSVRALDEVYMQRNNLKVEKKTNIAIAEPEFSFNSGKISQKNIEKLINNYFYQNLRNKL